jgi:plastocyanin
VFTGRSPLLRALVGAVVAAVAVAGCSGDDSAAVPDPNAQVAVLASDNHFDADTYTAHAGDVTFSYVERGHIPHTLLIEGVDGFKLEVRPSDKVDDGSVQLAPGTYTLYCDVPGHRATMHAQLDVS